MSEFLKAWRITLEHEGGYSDNYNDLGNFCTGVDEMIGTKYGITCNSYWNYYNNPPTAENMRNLTVSQAGEIAKGTIWTPYNLGAIPLQPIANQIFDIMFHFSPTTGADIIQKALISTGINLPYYGNDKIFGSETLNAIIKACNTGKGAELNQNLINYRVAYYENRVKTRPDQLIFLKGWLNRANDYALRIIKNKSLPYLVIALSVFGFISYKYSK
jgi:lysozyme family protein